MKHEIYKLNTIKKTQKRKTLIDLMKQYSQQSFQSFVSYRLECNIHLAT